MSEKQGKSVDLSAFDAAIQREEEGTDIPIFFGTKDTGLVIRVAGPDSQHAIKAQREITDGLVAKKLTRKLTPEETIEQNIRFVARITLGWGPDPIVDGKPLPFSVANAEKLFRKYPFIRDQVDRTGADRDRFLDG